MQVGAMQTIAEKIEFLTGTGVAIPACCTALPPARSGSLPPFLASRIPHRFPAFMLSRKSRDGL